MTRHSRLLPLAAALVATVALPALAAELAGAPSPFDKGGVKLALVSYISAGDFFQAYQSGAEAEAKKLGVDLRVFPGKQDATQEREQIEEAINLGVKGIVIDHGLPESLKDVAQKALDAGVKVVAFDVNLDNPKIPQVEQSDHLLARLALEQAIKDNGDKFKAGYVYVAGFAPLDRRDEVWTEFKKKNPGIEEIARWGAVDATTAATVADQTKAVLRSHPEITVVFAPYDEFARGVKLALGELGLNGKVKVYSADVSTASVRREGSPAARRLIDDVFEITDRKWRGIGTDSRQRIPPAAGILPSFDAQQRFAVEGIQVSESKVCISGLILQGLKKPHQCPAFGKACTPQTPLGATMVSSEGACAAYYHYGRYRQAAAVAAACRPGPHGGEIRQLKSMSEPAGVDFEQFSCPLPMVDYEQVLLGHGSGGTLTADLIQRVFMQGYGSSRRRPWKTRRRSRWAVRAATGTRPRGSR